jgi:sporulation protein YlmC with PRC-barrel domain
MKRTLLTAVSALALVAAMPALAAENTAKTQAQADMQVNAKGNLPTTNEDATTGSNHNPDLAEVPELKEGDIERGLDKAGNAISDAADSVADSFRAAFIDDEEMQGPEVTYVTINNNNTAKGMIGKDVRNGTGESVAKVDDIILDANGDAMMVVVANGGFLGLGEKQAAFDYDAITRQNTDGDVIMPLTKAGIDSAAEFSYDRKATGDKVRVIPAGGYSMKELLKAKVIDQNGDSLAAVDNITLNSGGANRVIVAFDQVLGMGGERAALDFDALKLTQTDSGVQFQLSAAQSANFEKYKKAVTSN